MVALRVVGTSTSQAALLPLKSSSMKTLMPSWIRALRKWSAKVHSCTLAWHRKTSIDMKHSKCASDQTEKESGGQLLLLMQETAQLGSGRPQVDRCLQYLMFSS